MQGLAVHVGIGNDEQLGQREHHARAQLVIGADHRVPEQAPVGLGVDILASVLASGQSGKIECGRLVDFGFHPGCGIHADD